jgi:hypothetical protein
MPFSLCQRNASFINVHTPLLHQDSFTNFVVSVPMQGNNSTENSSPFLKYSFG